MYRHGHWGREKFWFIKMGKNDLIIYFGDYLIRFNKGEYMLMNSL